MHAVLLLSLIFVLLAAALGQNIPSSADEYQKQQRNARSITQGLYVTLRNIIYPGELQDINDPVQTRFLLLTPGKPLNYFDYFPGKEYTSFIQDYNTKKREQVVPPHVMEKWFDLADNIPNNEPLAAGDTGKSLATIYGDILHETKIKGFDQKTQELQARYRQSVAFLNEFIRDPENPEKDISRLALYERYQELYNNRTLDMNNQVEDKRQNFGSLDFELWFQRNYPSLEANAQSAYTRWMVFGMKERVEAEVAYLDAGSSGSSLERARISLRSSAVSSLDRTRTIYPVSFEPSDWYKYLLPE